MSLNRVKSWGRFTARTKYWARAGGTADDFQKQNQTRIKVKTKAAIFSARLREALCSHVTSFCAGLRIGWKITFKLQFLQIEILLSYLVFFKHSKWSSQPGSFPSLPAGVQSMHFSWTKWWTFWDFWCRWCGYCFCCFFKAAKLGTGKRLNCHQNSLSPTLYWVKYMPKSSCCNGKLWKSIVAASFRARRICYDKPKRSSITANLQQS
jgi:hypothetical protein